MFPIVIVRVSPMTTPHTTNATPLNQPLSLPNGSALHNGLAKSSMSEALGT